MVWVVRDWVWDCLLEVGGVVWFELLVLDFVMGVGCEVVMGWEVVVVMGVVGGMFGEVMGLGWVGGGGGVLIGVRVL